ncbi:DUF6241 domain-containing protein [Paenisporosarcina macmurdoensis]|uniref:DUF6241 domain-containing protein n=1 Tax=Paenisporosarcina macmurdoensis TaxID=212659 RepID=A0ABW1LC27_9BACL
MKETKTKFKFTRLQKIVLSVTVLALIGYIGFSMYGENRPIIKKDGTITEKATEDGGKIIIVDEGKKIPVEEEFPFTMKDSQVATAIHAMSHQKIEADEKWGLLPLTTERVARLMDVIETNKNDYKNARLYMGILTRWSENDFSQIDLEHNQIWESQGGTIGRATGILSYEEEVKYIEQYYE